jgi:hypothetical protein
MYTQGSFSGRDGAGEISAISQVHLGLDVELLNEAGKQLACNFLHVHAIFCMLMQFSA